MKRTLKTLGLSALVATALVLAIPQARAQSAAIANRLTSLIVTGTATITTLATNVINSRTAATITYTSSVAASGTAIAHRFQTSTAISGTDRIAVWGANGTDRLGVWADGTLYPIADNVLYLGYGANRFKGIYMEGLNDPNSKQRVSIAANVHNGYLGNPPAAANSVAHKFSTTHGLTTAGASIGCYYKATSASDTFDTPVNCTTIDGVLKMQTTDSSGTPGNATINKPSGKVAIAAAAAAVTVTNSLVSASSQCVATMESADATCTYILRCVPGAGTFTITANANCTAAATVSFKIFDGF